MRLKNRIMIITVALALLQSCISIGPQVPWLQDLHTLAIQLVYPSGHASVIRAGVEVSVENYGTGSKYILSTDNSGNVETKLPNGIYRISVSDKVGSNIFNGSIDKVLLSGEDKKISLELEYSEAGVILIKEIYFGGCSMAPKEGTYQSDKYFILHNNSSERQYLDDLCFGTLAPYNSSASQIKWTPTGELPDFLPIVQAVMRVGGKGTDYPLDSGEDAIFCINGAVDHTVNYPLSVNLNRPDCFVCYNTTYFPNPLYHPAPGDKVRADHILEVVIKTGQANAYTFSVNSPTLVIFKAKGVKIDEYVHVSGNIVQIPGSNEKVVKIPLDWVIDGVEVFNGSSSSNSKRLNNSIDSGFISFSETFKGRTVMRKKDEEASSAKGFEVLLDTNNSANDLYESEVQSLHK
ncbi:MAG: DUF4876 domain-containing protein [Candidatus Cryptobacteroides sp.]